MRERRKLIELREGRPRSSIARALQITPQMLGAIERGSRTPSLALAKRIADYYDAPVDSIFFEANGHNASPDGPTSSAGASESQSA